MFQIDYIEIIGLIAATCTTAAFLPQVYKTWKTKDVAGLSLPMVLMLFIGVALWLLYGFLMKSISIIIANSITIISIFLLVYFKIKHHKK
ncbi:SemiSWEET transporter [Yeosuana sp. MJ-SS3]|uniref:SemiSWEET transporter n=1 Tax=Gilvirhabdus luticola TaxID=3079858 RepID=A0ABU3U3G0_9FLAO|nr:SemiSWEET transporter [Yeosuana sp. MJ-SS3]MDU8884944.1 SemiSWEET transporter [Yeosuana sp. MJ-SS3]